jgi:alpha-glucosidase
LQRGVWLFPPEQGAFDWSAVEDQGDGNSDGAGALERWRVAGQADKEKIVVEVHHDKSGGAAEHTLTLLLPPQEGRSLRVTGHAGEPVEDRGRRGIRITL